VSYGLNEINDSDAIDYNGLDISGRIFALLHIKRYPALILTRCFKVGKKNNWFKGDFGA